MVIQRFLFSNCSMHGLMLFGNAVDLAHYTAKFHQHRAGNLLHSAAQHDRGRDCVELGYRFKCCSRIILHLHPATAKQHVNNAALDQVLQHAALLFCIMPFQLRTRNGAAQRLCKHNSPLRNAFRRPKMDGVRQALRTVRLQKPCDQLAPIRICNSPGHGFGHRHICMSILYGKHIPQSAALCMCIQNRNSTTATADPSLRFPVPVFHGSNCRDPGALAMDQ